jgi:hypothetical protein
MPSKDITVLDIAATEDASFTFADVLQELHKQMAIIQFALADVSQRGRGEWLDKLHEDVEILQLYLDEAAAQAIDISDYLYDMVSDFRGDSAYVDGDDYGEID